MSRKSLFALIALLAACSQAEESPVEDGGTAQPSPVVASASPPASPSPASDDGRARYTSLSGCALVRSAPDEAGFFEHECAGEGGWRLRHTEADLREDLVLVAPDGDEHDLGLVALAQGAFTSLGDSVEWRGREERGRFVPSAMIVRQQVMEDPDPARPERSYLVAVRLVPAPCVLARVIPGVGQNERARDIADNQRACLSGD